MDWLENLNRAMDYIEGHLEGEISYDRAAQLAGCSKYHLLRMFPYLTGVSLSEYIGGLCPAGEDCRAGSAGDGLGGIRCAGLRDAEGVSQGIQRVVPRFGL